MGCDLGPRPIIHLKAFEVMGAKHSMKQSLCVLRLMLVNALRVLISTWIRSVGATINTMLAAAKADGPVIENAAREPEIIDVATLLSIRARVYVALVQKSSRLTV